MVYKKNNVLAVSIGVLAGVCLLGNVWTGCRSTARVWTSEQHDSILREMVKVNPKHALAWVDSLEAEKEESHVRLAFYRAQAYNKMGQKKTAEEWCEKALEGDELLHECRVNFYATADMKFSILTYKDEFEQALEAAQMGFEATRTDMTPEGRQWTAVLLHEVGYGQMQLGQIEQAENSFSQAYIALKQISLANPTIDNLSTFARVSYNILDAYTSTGQLDKASAWVASTEDAVNRFVASPECTEETRVDYLGGLAMQKALILVQTGHREEADSIYDDVLTSDYADTALGIAERSTYLEKAERYDDIAEMMPQIDSVATVWGTPSAFAHLEKYRKD